MIRPRIAVALSKPYRGDVLRDAARFARALWEESRQAGEDASVVFAYPARQRESREWEAELAPGIESRAIQWQTIDRQTARRAMLYAGHADWHPEAGEYVIAEDWTQQLCDCDLWIVVGDGLPAAVLPLRANAVALFEASARSWPSATRVFLLRSPVAGGGECWGGVRECL